MNSNKSPSTVDGVRAIELFYRPVRRIKTGTPAFYQSQMRLNSPLMGTMLPDFYRTTAENSGQCVELFQLGMVQLLRSMKAFEEKGTLPRHISIYMPVRYLLNENSAGDIVKMCTRFEVDPDNVCFEVSSDLLFEKGGTAPAVVSALSAEGFHFMLADFGSAGSPLFEIAEFPFDYVILDRAVCLSVGKSERKNTCIKSLTGLASQLGAEVIVPYADKEHSEIFSELGCLYTADGDFISARYAFRRKSENKSGGV